MYEPYATPEWDRAHASFHAALARLFDRVAVSFRRLVAIQYDAPWERTACPRPRVR